MTNKTIAAVAAACTLTGCAGLSAQGYAAHQSQPGHGAGFQPIGNNDRTPETTFESLGVGLRLERGVWFAESSLDWVVHDTHLTGGPWVFNLRAGMRVSLEGK